MIALIWQTALLLLGAYFLGAFLACVVRRTFFARAPRPMPAPVQPSTNEAAARFERALIGQGTATAAAATATAAAGPDHSAALLSAARSIGTAARRSAPRPAPGGNAEAAAALSAAAATAERRQPGPAETGLAVALPAASGTTGQSAVAAQVSMPSPRAQVPKVAAAADDLTRIRGIDAALRARLDARGIRSFAQIASWRAEDVERIGAELDVRGRISEENWIEQAQILAGGGETFYLQSRARPAAAAAEPARPIAAATAAAAAAAAAPGASDKLQRIAGIDRDLERRLNDEGVDHYRQIAAWSAGDIARFDGLLGLQGRIAAEYWVEQARVLSGGGETAFSRAFDRMGGALPRQAPPAEAGGPAAATEREAARQARNDISALRSVRSEAYRAAEGSPPADAGAIRGADDLKRIRGIGLLIEKRLNAMGVSRYEQIAHWTAEDVERVSSKLDFKGRIERENWIEQARILASGGQTEFSRRIDRGEVEKRR